MRNSIIKRLGPDISKRIARSPRDDVEVTNIVEACLDHEDGLDHLLKTLVCYEDNSEHVQRVKKVVNKILIEDEREKASQRGNLDACLKIDKDEVVVPFDLEDLKLRFHEHVGYRNFSAFTVGSSDYQIFQEYILPRIEKELRDKTHRPLKAIHFEPIGDNFEKDSCFRSLCDSWEGLAGHDILLVVYNYYIPPQLMRETAQNFLKDFEGQIQEFVTRQQTCFVLLWINVGAAPLDGFQVLPVPQKFNMEDLSAYLKGYFERWGINTDRKEKYLKSLEIHKGDFVITFQKMIHILNELQGAR